MGLFSNTTVDRAIASLFGRATKQEDLVKAKEQSSASKPAEQAHEVPREAPKPEHKSGQAKPEHKPELEDSYIRRKVRKANEKDTASEEGNVDDASVASDASADESVDASADASVDASADASVDASADASVASADASVDASAETLTAKDKAENTVFVKNVPNAVITDRQALKQFKKLFGPGIQSVRFRSIAMSEIVPRKVAFIKQKLNENRDSVNSYIVYKSKDRVYEVMNEMNGKEFMEHHLFVDSASRPRPQVPGQSVFIGNLSFDATEEQLYGMFADCGPIENLRIVRDRKFNIGKGFAYVQFDSVSTVQLALLKNGQEFGGRALRVTRCSKKEQKPARALTGRSSERSFKQKQTPRSRQGKPRASDSVLEGERAKAGDKIELGRKRKARHDKQTKPKKARR